MILDGFSCFGHYYIYPDYDYEYESVQAESFLAGSHKFQVSEIEVYSKKWNKYILFNTYFTEKISTKLVN